MSLRRTLFLVVIGMLTLVAVYASYSAYDAASEEANEFLDRQLQQMTRFIGERAFLSADTAQISQENLEDDYVVTVRYRDGRPMQTSHPQIGLPDASATGFSDITSAGTAWRLYSLVLPDRTVQIAQQMAVRHEIAQDGARNAALPIVGAIPILWLLLAALLHLMFKPLERTAREVSGRTADDTHPIRIDGVPSEVKPLVEGFNTLLVRLEASIARQKTFMADAAHELRTPLAAMMLQLGNLRRAEIDPEVAERLDDLNGGMRRASDLIDKLLTLARSDATIRPRLTTEVELDTVVMQAVADLTPLAAEHDIDLGFTRCERVHVLVAPEDLRSIAEILLDNAIRHTPQGTIIDVRVEEIEGTPHLTIADNGPGVPEIVMPQLFDRFFRAARPDVVGSGLGLAIARSIADRNGIRIKLANRSDSSGLIATLAFKSAPL